MNFYPNSKGELNLTNKNEYMSSIFKVIHLIPSNGVGGVETAARTSKYIKSDKYYLLDGIIIKNQKEYENRG